MTPLDWVTGDDTGISSLAIWEHMTGQRVASLDRWGRRPPQDPSDFGRCHRLLALFPEWRARLSEFAETHPAWEGVVAQWDDFVRIYERDEPTGKSRELYDRLKKALTPGVKCGDIR